MGKNDYRQTRKSKWAAVRRALGILLAAALFLTLPANSTHAADMPTPFFESGDASPVSELYVMGSEVVKGGVTSGTGWSFAGNRLTLNHLNVAPDDYNDGVKNFLQRTVNSPNQKQYFELHLIGDNTITAANDTDTVFRFSRRTVVKITGEPGAKLHINGFFQGEYEISGDVEVIVDTRSAVFFDYGVDLDDHARLTINSYNDKQNFSVYIADGGQVSVKNGSELTVNTFNTDVDNAAYYSVYGNAPFLVEDARLAVHNAHPNGVAVRLYDPFGGTGVNPGLTASITNATVTLDSPRGMMCHSAVIAGASQINTGENTALAFIGEKGEIAISDSSINGVTASYYDSADHKRAYRVYGKASLPRDLTVDEEESMTILSGGSLSGTGTLSGGGTFTTENLTEDMIAVPADLYYNGEDRTAEIEQKSAVRSGVEICGKTFDVSGWTVEVSKISDFIYHAVYADGNDPANTFTKTITLQKSGANLAGNIQTYQGDTETSSFAIGDTITVKAMPEATGAAPGSLAVSRGNFTPPADGEMAVYYEGQQISAPSTETDGVYTMTVNTGDLPGEALNREIPLTVRFVGDDLMAGTEAAVQVTVTADAKVGEDDFYPTLQRAFDSFYQEGEVTGTVTLLRDIVLKESVDFKHSYENVQYITMELNGKRITASDTLLNVSADTFLTILDSSAGQTGGIYADGSPGYAVYVNPRASVQLTGGTFYGEECGVRVEGALSVCGEAVLSGGYALRKPEYSQQADIRLSGGVFRTTRRDGSPIAVTCYGTVYTLRGLLDTSKNEEGIYYAYFDESGVPITKGLDDAVFPYDISCVTVGECTHPAHAYSHTSGTAVHTMTCLACGKVEGEQTCTFDENGSCPCGAVLSLRLPDDLKLTYDGAAHTPDVTVTLDEIELDAASYEVSYHNHINAGTDTAVVAVSSTRFNGTVKKNFSIERAPLVVRACDQTITYGEGVAQGIAQVTSAGLVSGDRLDGIALTASTRDVPGGVLIPSDADIKNSSGGNVSGNYEITYEAGNLAIRRAEGTLTVLQASIGKTFGDVVFSLNCSTNGDGEISYVSSDENVALVSAAGTVQIRGAGTAVIWASLAEGFNYTGGAQEPVTVTVAKADAPPAIKETRNYHYVSGSGGAVTIDVAGKLPENRGKTTYTMDTTDENTILSGVSVDDNGTLHFTVPGNRLNGDKASIAVTAEMANYEDAVYTLEIALTASTDCEHGHTERRGVRTATCQNMGYSGDIYCLDCGELREKGHATEKAAHSGGMATCVSGKICVVCGAVYTEKDSACHMHTQVRGRLEATGTADGYTGDTYCTDCGKKISSGVVIVATGGSTVPDTEGGNSGAQEGDSQAAANSLTKEQKKQVAALTKKLGVSKETAIKIQAVGEQYAVPEQTLLISEQTVTGHKSEADIKGSTFALLKARVSKTTNTQITLKWNKVKGADGYLIYGNKCGKANKYKLIKTVKKNGTTTFTQKKLKKGTFYKYIVRAYKEVDGHKITLAASKTIHFVTSGGSYGNEKALKVNKTKVSLKRGESFTIQAAAVKGSKKLVSHRKLCFESDNPGVASVTAKGKIKTAAKGTCRIYVYAQSGVFKKITVTVH